MSGKRLRKYGVEATIDFEVYEVDGVDLRVDWVPAQADCEIMKDGGASTLCDNTATDEGSTYSIVLTATEMQFARGVLKIVDAATKVLLDTVVHIETYGNASALHAFDLDDADGSTLTETGGDGDHLTESGGTGDQLTAINLPNQTMDIVGSITGNLSGSVGSVTGAVGSVTGAVGSVGAGGITAASLAADCITEAKIADNAIAAEHLATDAIATDAVAATALDKVVMSDLATGAPSATASLPVALNWLYESFRNKTTTTATLITIMKDDGSTALAKSTISDDATTFTKAEFISGA